MSLLHIQWPGCPLAEREQQPREKQDSKTDAQGNIPEQLLPPRILASPLPLPSLNPKAEPQCCQRKFRLPSRLPRAFGVLENTALTDKILHTTEKSQQGGITEHDVNAAVPLMSTGRLLQESCRQLLASRDREGLWNVGVFQRFPKRNVKLPVHYDWGSTTASATVLTTAAVLAGGSSVPSAVALTAQPHISAALRFRAGAHTASGTAVLHSTCASASFAAAGRETNRMSLFSSKNSRENPDHLCFFCAFLSSCPLPRERLRCAIHTAFQLFSSITLLFIYLFIFKKADRTLTVRCLIPCSFGQKLALTLRSRYMLSKDGLCSLQLFHLCTRSKANANSTG